MASNRDDYRGDVWYEEWRRGLPEGAISDDRIEDGYYAGRSPESLVSGEMQRRADARAAREQEEYEREWYEEQERQAFEEQFREEHGENP